MNNKKTEKKVQNIISEKCEVVWISLKKFLKENYSLQATALTYYTLFAVVPILALLFGIAKGFNLEEKLKTIIAERFAEQQDIVVWMYKFADTTLKNADGGIIAGIGILVLLWTVLRLATYIENSFNQIWKVAKGRNFFRKISDYLSILIITPVLLVIMSSSTIFAQKMVVKLPETLVFNSQYGLLLLTLGIELLPIVMAWLLFAFIYIFIPNTKVKIGSALFGGFFAALLYYAAQMAYINIQLKLSSYNSIYGSFSALPLFLIWMQWSWMITLLGAKIAFVNQFFRTGEFKFNYNKLSNNLCNKYLLTICHIIVSNFNRTRQLMTENEIVDHTGLPLALVREALNNLNECGVIQKIDSDEIRFIPGIPLDKMTIQYIQKCVNNYGQTQNVAFESTDFTRISDLLAKIEESADKSPGNRLLKDF